MSDLKTADGSSRPCVPGKQKRVSFEEVDSPPKVGEFGSKCSGVYDSTFSSSLGGSQIHRSPIASIGRCSGSRSSNRPQKSGSSAKSEVSGSSRTNGDDGLVADVATVRHHLVRSHTNALFPSFSRQKKRKRRKVMRERKRKEEKGKEEQL